MTTTTSTPPVASSPALTGHALPQRPTRYVPTTTVQNVEIAVQLAARTGACALIDGPVGVGKTTAVVEAARTVGTDAVYVNMVGTTSPREQMDAIWTAITGTHGVGTAAHIRHDILEALLRQSTILLIDDAHHVGFAGLAPILAIWNRCHTARGKGTPIVLCGNHLERHLTQTLPELLSRASLCVEVPPLAGAPLLNTLLAMEPTIAGTDPETLKAIDRRRFKGELRRWNDFFNLLAVRRGYATAPMPLSDDEAQGVLAMMPKGKVT